MSARGSRASLSGTWPLLRHALASTATQPTCWMVAILLAATTLPMLPAIPRHVDIWIGVQLVMGLSLNHAALMVVLNAHPERTANLLARAGISRGRGAAFLALYGALIVALSPVNLITTAFLISDESRRGLLGASAAAVLLCGAALAPTGLFFLGLSQAGCLERSPMARLRMLPRLPALLLPPAAAAGTVWLVAPRVGLPAAYMLVAACFAPLSIAIGSALEGFARRP